MLRPDRVVTVEHWDVFARAPGGGNPCPILRADLPGADLQAIAAHFGHETGVILAGLRFRYFVPRHEMSMCVHATVAAITSLVADGTLSGGTATVTTASGPCTVTWDDSEPPLVSVEQQAPAIGPAVELDGLTEALGIDAIGGPVRPVSVSRAKLMVPLSTAEQVHAVAPTLPLLWDVCRRHDTTGAYVYAPHGDGRPEHAVARQFPVDAGYPEDPATGVAAGALAVHLADLRGTDGWLEVEIDQGDAMGRPSRLVACAYRTSGVVRRSVVSGTAQLVGREELQIGPR